MKLLGLNSVKLIFTHITCYYSLGCLISSGGIQMKVSESMESFTTKTKTVQIHLILSTLIQNEKLQNNVRKNRNLRLRD